MTDIKVKTEKIVDIEPWSGFDDAVSVWMALVTERERLRRVVGTGQVQEPMFGPPQITRELSGGEVEEVRKKLARVSEMASLVLSRRELVAATFASDPEKSALARDRAPLCADDLHHLRVVRAAIGGELATESGRARWSGETASLAALDRICALG